MIFQMVSYGTSALTLHCLCLRLSLPLVSPHPSLLHLQSRRGLLAEQSTKALSRYFSHIIPCGYLSRNAKETHFSLSNDVLNIRLFYNVRWFLSSDYSKLSIKNLSRTWANKLTNALFEAYSLGHCSVMGMGNKTGLLDLWKYKLDSLQMCGVTDYTLTFSKDLPNPQAFLKHVFASVVTFTFFLSPKVSQSLPPVHLHPHCFFLKEQTQ